MTLQPPSTKVRLTDCSQDLSCSLHFTVLLMKNCPAYREVSSQHQSGAEAVVDVGDLCDSLTINNYLAEGV